MQSMPLLLSYLVVGLQHCGDGVLFSLRLLCGCFLSVLLLAPVLEAFADSVAELLDSLLVGLHELLLLFLGVDGDLCHVGVLAVTWLLVACANWNHGSEDECPALCVDVAGL